MASVSRGKSVFGWPLPHSNSFLFLLHSGSVEQGGLTGNLGYGDVSSRGRFERTWYVLSLFLEPTLSTGVGEVATSRGYGKPGVVGVAHKRDISYDAAAETQRVERWACGLACLT